MTPQAFVVKWGPGEPGHGLNERQGAQQHFIELCALLGVDAPTGANDGEDDYLFEKGLRSLGAAGGAGRGFADVFKRGCFAWEYKAPGRPLDAALSQLMRYALALGLLRRAGTGLRRHGRAAARRRACRQHRHHSRRCCVHRRETHSHRKPRRLRLTSATATLIENAAVDKPAVRKTKLKAEDSSLAYWLSRPMAERIAAVETLRQHYIAQHFNAEPRLQRVCRVTQLKSR